MQATSFWYTAMNERDIFIAALHQRDPAARADLLDRDCAGDQPLRIRVEELLREQEQLGSFLERPAAGLGETGAFTPPEGGETVVALFEGPGTMIGPYKLLEPIGEGGMGTVFLAQQSEPVKRLVALKVIKAGMDSRQVVARFEAERQALALMDHHHIAKVLDGGTTTGGRPYFVMELVKGVPLTRYCDEQRLTPRQRLELFVPVCQAIQHAHQKGIIHRDVKPSNVLVALYDGQAVPKVIDFGIAKATSQPLTEKTLVTGLGSVVGTLEYMSPEQAELNQMDVDTRSDVYSLGVLLYELLTGTTPLERKRLKDTGLLEVLRLIREEEPPRPSTRLSSTDERPSVAANRGLEPKKLSGLVRGELDWIVMKSLEKDRNRRYETANGFAADVQRYLHDEPVLACPPSAVYRLRKFARRNQGSLAVAALVLFSLASLGGVAGWAAWDRTTRRAALEADVGRNLDAARAFCRADQLREASAVLDHAQALVSRGEVGGELARRVALVRTDVDMAARLEAIRLEKAAVKDEHFDWAGADVQYGEAFRDYGLDVGQLGPGEAAARLEVSAIREQLVTALDDWSLSTSGGNRQQLLAVLTRADADPWRTQLRTAFVDGNAEALRELAGEPNVSVQSAGAAVLMGNALCQLGDIGLAVEYLRGAQQEYPSDFWLNQNLGSLLMHLKSARMCEAVGYLRAALALRPDSPGVLVNLGLALRDQGNIAGALAAFQKAIARKPDYAMAHCNLGDTLGQQGDLAGALAAYQKAVALKPNYAYAHYLLGNALRDQGNLSGALAAFQKAIALKPNYAEAHCNLGHVLRRQGEFAKALE
ncbi:MAG: protein kinase domain-containing protein, partial [Gemmataceae bacterium]